MSSLPPPPKVNGFPHPAPDSMSPIKRLLDSRRMNNLLEMKFGGPVTDLLSTLLFEPIQDLLKRPGKNTRARLVKLGFKLARPANNTNGLHDLDCLRIMEAMEFLHAGALAVDDVQDGSKMRRGQPSLHLKYGMPAALNTGSWLHFLPLEIIRELGLPVEQELVLYRLYHRTLLRSHVGQALDVGLRIDSLPQQRVYEVCMASLELKTGAFFALALMVGAVLGGATLELLECLDSYGHGFGMALQMFDDINNITGEEEPAKRWEDMMLRRPTWIWALAARDHTAADYSQFISAVHQLPHDRHIQRWFEQHDFLAKAKRSAVDHFENCFLKLASQFSPPGVHEEALKEIHLLGEEMAGTPEQ